MDEADTQQGLLGLTTEIVAAYTGHNTVATSDLPGIPAPPGSKWICAVYTVTIDVDATATVGQTVVLSAQWVTTSHARVIERLGSLDVVLPSGPLPPNPISTKSRGSRPR